MENIKTDNKREKGGNSGRGGGIRGERRGKERNGEIGKNVTYLQILETFLTLMETKFFPDFDPLPLNLSSEFSPILQCIMIQLVYRGA